MNEIYRNIISSSKENYLLAKKIKANFNSLYYFGLRKNSFPDIVNCGAPRSGSTLINIIIKKILVLKIQKNDNYCGTERDYINHLKNADHLHLTKTHVYSHFIAQRIANKKSVGVFTHRDIRDVIVSYLQKGWINNIDDFIKGSKLKFYSYDAILYAKTKNMIIISYEELMSDRKRVIQILSDKLNANLSIDEINHIYEETSASTTKKMISTLSFTEGTVKRYDKNTGLHENHINDPKPEKWKTYFSDTEIETINKAAEDYLNFFNYKIC